MNLRKKKEERNLFLKIHTYIHTYMHNFCQVCCKFVNKTYIEPHDMRKNMASVRGGGAEKKRETVLAMLNNCMYNL